jgi:hypothetical protein
VEEDNTPGIVEQQDKKALGFNTVLCKPSLLSLWESSPSVWIHKEKRKKLVSYLNHTVIQGFFNMQSNYILTNTTNMKMLIAW